MPSGLREAVGEHRAGRAPTDTKRQGGKGALTLRVANPIHR